MSAAGSTELVKSNGAPPAVGAQPTGQIMPVYFQGFEGTAVAPFPDEARAVLAERVDPRDVEIRPDGIVYMSGVWYRRQLTRAFGAGAWSIVPRGPARTMGDLIVYHGALIILGRFVAEAVGECATRFGMTYASALEGARTDCLTRCCKDLGLATELWDKTWREAWVRDCAFQDGVDSKGKPKWKKRDGSEHQQAPLFKAAGGEAAKAEHPKADTATETDRAPSAASPAKDTAAIAPVGDNGEAATDEQKTAIAALLKTHGWKKQATVVWLKATFDQASLGALTREQADTAHALLCAYGKPVYDSILKSFAAAGKVRS